MHIFYTPDISFDAPSYTLNEEESKHCIRVMRLSLGSEIVLVDGNGGWFESVIVDDNAKRCTVNITKSLANYHKRTYSLHMAIAPTKNMDRTEWFLEKATELGLEELSLLLCQNSERGKIKTERLEKVAVAAIKQSQKAFLPKINDARSFHDFISSHADFSGGKYIAHCREPLSSNHKKHLKICYESGKNGLVLIGPEGDFTKEEITLALKNGFVEISLGNSRLRTETAALYACCIINMIND